METIKSQVDYWKEGAVSDLETAEILIKKMKLKEGLFFCHLTIEKLLKAIYVNLFKDNAPKTHRLFYFIEKCNIEPDEDTINFLGVLMKYQLEGRYPDYDPGTITKMKANEYLQKTKGLFTWLTAKLQSL